MEASDLIKEVQREFIISPPTELVKDKINNIIRIINGGVGKKREILRITGTDGLWEDLDSTWEDLDEEWGDLARFLNGFTWDSDEYKLTIPDIIDKVETLWVDDKLWKSRKYETVINSLYSNIYCHIGNNIYFSEDMEDSTKIIKAEVKMKFPQIDKDGNIDLPEDYHLILVSGAIHLLAITQKYRDEGLYLIHKDIYENQLDIMRVKTNSADTPGELHLGAVDDMSTNYRTTDYYKE